MKILLKTLLILLLMGGLVAGGVYGYTRYTQSQPVKVQPVSNWLMDYAPNQTYLGGSVISGESLLLTGNRDRTPLDIYVSEGQSVRTGDPLLRYDITKDTLELDEKLLERQKLYDTLEGLYKEYKRYAFEDYERTIPTATPTFTPTPRTEGEAPRDGSSLGIVRLSARMQQSMARRGGDGSEGDPYEFEVDMDSGLSDPIPESLLLQLQAQVATTHQPVHAWFTVRDTQGDSRPLGYLFLRFLPLENGVDRLNINLTAMTETKEPVAVMDADTMTPTGGHGYLKDPYIFSYREGYEVPGAFFSRYCRQANARGSYLYAELRGRRLTVAVDFTSMGTCILRLKPTPQVTPPPRPAGGMGGHAADPL